MVVRQNRTEHIALAELMELLEPLPGHGVSLAEAEAQHHLAICAHCRKQFEEMALLDRQLPNMRRFGSALPLIDCPAPDVWREIAGGLIPPEQTFTQVQHASNCGHCGPLLRRALAELNQLRGELTESERNDIAGLESASGAWQQRLAERITGTPHSSPDRDNKPWWRRLNFLTAAMLGAYLLAEWVRGS